MVLRNTCVPSPKGYIFRVISYRCSLTKKLVCFKRRFDVLEAPDTQSVTTLLYPKITTCSSEPKSRNLAIHSIRIHVSYL